MSSGELSGYDIKTLFLACKTGDLQLVKQLLQLGLQCEALIHNGSDLNPLIAAAKYGHASIIRLLLDYGMQPCIIDSSNMTALSHACALGWAEAVDTLLSHNSEDHSRDSSYYITALCESAKHGFAYIAQIFVAHGVSLNSNRYIEPTPLAIAATFDHLDVVNVLLSGGADPNFGSAKALTMACRKGILRIAYRLLEAGATPSEELVICCSALKLYTKEELDLAEHTIKQPEWVAHGNTPNYVNKHFTYSG